MNNVRKEIIEKAEEFVKNELLKAADFKRKTRRDAEYRIEHSFRVANIAVEIAKKEGFDEERMYVAALLHDIGYSIELETKEEHRNHGRIGAAIARPFLQELGYEDKDINEMCYGIAIHVDDKADFEGESTPFALTIQDADNLDRFDAYRLYEGLMNAEFEKLSIDEQKELVENKIQKLSKLREIPFGTNTATEMWKKRIDFQLDFFNKLRLQFSNSGPKY